MYCVHLSRESVLIEIVHLHTGRMSHSQFRLFLFTFGIDILPVATCVIEQLEGMMHIGVLKMEFNHMTPAIS